jgi:hypothetical protein
MAIFNSYVKLPEGIWGQFIFADPLAQDTGQVARWDDPRPGLHGHFSTRQSVAGRMVNRWILLAKTMDNPPWQY